MNSPYFLIPISLAITLYYLLGSLMVQAGIIPFSTHRKFWNFALLFVFLGCALLGILLAININYKLGWGLVNDILQWHVQLGIAMSMVAFIHTLWHRGYFSKYLLFKGKQTKTVTVETKHQLVTSAFALGLLSVSLQVLLIRQFTKVFQGNEFLITWIIGIWMLISGAGALVGGKSSDRISIQKVTTKALWFMYGSAVLFIFLAGEIRQTFFPSGVLIAPYHVIVMVVLMITPTAFPSGMVYALLTKQVKSQYPTIYAYEALGSLAGGLLLSLVIIWILNTYLAAIAIGFLASLIIAYPLKNISKLTIPLLLLSIGISVKSLNFDIKAESMLFPGQKVLSVTDSPHGSITVTGSEDQLNFFGNGSMLFGTQNTIYCEETVHYTMAQRLMPSKVLLVSGGYAGLIDELKKYKHVKVDYVEPNPHILKMSQLYCKVDFPENAKIFKSDIRGFLRKSSEKYDIAIITIPEPTSLEQNRFFTIEFLELLKKHLTADGVVSISLSGIGNYLSAPRQKAYASIIATFKSVFDKVEVISGERDYLLASDSPIRIDIAQLLSEQHIGEANLYVRPDYINDEHIAQRSQFFHRQTESAQKTNTDNHPWPVLQNTLGYLSMFGFKIWLLLVVGTILLLIPFFVTNYHLRAMYAVGFAGSAIQTLYLLALQIAAGVLYGTLGAMIALFMGGLALGSMAYGKVNGIKPKHIKISLIGSFFILIALFIPLMHLEIWLLITIVSAGILTASFSVGYLYISITENSKSYPNQPAKIYAADLMGSAAGIVIVTLLLIPSIGFLLSITVLLAFIGFYLFLKV